MAKQASRTNDKFAQSIAKITLETSSRVLVFVGKPFYLLLSGLLVFFLFISYSIGSVITKPIIALIKIINSPKKIKLSLPKSSPPVFPKSVNIPGIYKIITIFILLVGLGVFGFWYKVLKDLPDVNDLTQKRPAASTKIYDRNGILLYKIYKDQNRTPVTFSDIPDSVKLATIAVEDEDFYRNPGFSLKGITRSIFNNLKSGQISGGSTITQQLVKNTLLSPEKTITRKIKELILAIRVEQKFSKDQILEMYLNQVSYGGTAYGIEAASEFYFNKKVNDLNLAEAAFLSGLPQSPTFYSPYGDNPKVGMDRQKQVLRLMLDDNFISKDNEQKAENTNLTFASPKIDIKAPHFIMYIKDQLTKNNLWNQPLPKSRLI